MDKIVCNHWSSGISSYPPELLKPSAGNSGRTEMLTRAPNSSSMATAGAMPSGTPLEASVAFMTH